jgi:plasmid stability protein
MVATEPGAFLVGFGAADGHAQSALISMLSSKFKEVSVAQFLVRDVEEAVAAELKRRAAEHGRSTEAEHREILREVLLVGRKPAKRSFTEVLASMPYVREDDDLFDVR